MQRGVNASRGTSKEEPGSASEKTIVKVTVPPPWGGNSKVGDLKGAGRGGESLIDLPCLTKPTRASGLQPSSEHYFKEEWEGKTMHIGV